MKVYLFNPGHDIALAAHQKYVTLPHAARQLQADLAYLPVLWATDGDLVLVEDKEHVSIPAHLRQYAAVTKFIDYKDLASLGTADVEICPWGWNLALRNGLIEMSNGKLTDVLPSEQRLDDMRMLSGRRWCAENLLPSLTTCFDKAVGKADVFTDYASLCQYLQPINNGLAYQYVLKMPWSSSGRGLRFVDMNHEGITTHLQGWIKNVINKQGYITVEPYYNKVCDFGMEFYAHQDGTIDYLGLSVFDTVNGAYTGNLLMGEAQKEEILSRYTSLECFKRIRETVVSVMSKQLKGNYSGPFGIDMMIIKDGVVHPCVELNLRQTMGHVALTLSKKVNIPRVMRMGYRAGHYSIHINALSPTPSDN